MSGLIESNPPFSLRAHGTTSSAWANASTASCSRPPTLGANLRIATARSISVAPPPGTDDAVLEHARDDLERVLERALDLLGDVFGAAADQDGDRAGVLAARDEGHVLLADLALLDQGRVPQVRLGELAHSR